MNNDPNVGLGVQQLNNQSSREWMDLTPYVSGFTQFPAPVTEEKPSAQIPAGSINYFPAAACRVNAEGLVLMRGLLQKNAGNIATGDVIMTIPRNIRQLFPQENRFFGGTCVLRIDPALWQLKVDIVYSATTWVILNNVIYYKD